MKIQNKNKKKHIRVQNTDKHFHTDLFWWELEHKYGQREESKASWTPKIRTHDCEVSNQSQNHFALSFYFNFIFFNYLKERNLIEFDILSDFYYFAYY